MNHVSIASALIDFQPNERNKKEKLFFFFFEDSHSLFFLFWFSAKCCRFFPLLRSVVHNEMCWIHWKRVYFYQTRAAKPVLLSSFHHYLESTLSTTYRFLPTFKNPLLVYALRWFRLSHRSMRPCHTHNRHRTYIHTHKHIQAHQPISIPANSKEHQSFAPKVIILQTHECKLLIGKHLQPEMNEPIEMRLHDFWPEFSVAIAFVRAKWTWTGIGRAGWRRVRSILRKFKHKTRSHRLTPFSISRPFIILMKFIGHFMFWGPSSTSFIRQSGQRNGNSAMLTQNVNSSFVIICVVLSPPPSHTTLSHRFLSFSVVRVCPVYSVFKTEINKIFLFRIPSWLPLWKGFKVSDCFKKMSVRFLPRFASFWLEYCSSAPPLGAYLFLNAGNVEHFYVLQFNYFISVFGFDYFRRFLVTKRKTNLCGSMLSIVYQYWFCLKALPRSAISLRVTWAWIICK